MESPDEDESQDRIMRVTQFEFVVGSPVAFVGILVELTGLAHSLQ